MIQAKRKNWKLKSVAIFLLVVAAVGFYRWHLGPTIFLGSQTVGALRNPDRVEVLKTAPHDWVTSTDLRIAAGGHRITAMGATLDRKSASQVGKLLTSKRTFFPFGGFDPFGCGLEPGVAFRFTKGSTTTDVLACYTCQHLIFQTQDGQQKLSSYVMPYRVDQLKPFFQQGFPQDKKLFEREFETDN